MSIQNTKLSNDDIISAYEFMLFIRRFEEKASELYGQGKIGGFCHLYIGQEAVACGIKYAKSANDKIITAYRDHGLILACDCDPKSVMAELTGRIDGTSLGKGGSMHIFDIKNNFYGGHGIVGAQVSIGTGLGFAAKYKSDNSVSITLMGDGAANQGQVYESFNMAKLWNLPVLYIIENNGYAMGTSVKRSSSTTSFFNRGISFEIPGFAVDGMDFFTVYDAIRISLDKIRNGSGPQLIEIITYRYRGHSMSDPAKYRTKDEVEHFKSKDPIQTLKKHILNNNIANEIIFKEIDKKIKQKINDIEKFSLESPLPNENLLYEHIYSN
ncbi:pyruvate dehydrogenase (acetyl-transferring) E1 component subunit alpha [Lyticum sinuosum]|uniref:Pyruvate dehydrogenase E1 component subunit alpha n=1 Tax=Lyticum sinuosum TaxID=1332059 RepID=A0AAE4VLP2_9RICK|nr:pyruvate dehydrogenase (acetyl-transferring) E1 component subunit alpha [Lyticum sinuosum]MDZ5761096.1 Pyruvate dehydrogenase E1 subunit alpha [Lyticum sinuosum]